MKRVCALVVKTPTVRQSQVIFLDRFQPLFLLFTVFFFFLKSRAETEFLVPDFLSFAEDVFSASVSVENIEVPLFFWQYNDGLLGYSKVLVLRN